MKKKILGSASILLLLVTGFVLVSCDKNETSNSSEAVVVEDTKNSTEPDPKPVQDL